MSLPVSRSRCLPAVVAALLLGGLAAGCGSVHQVASGGSLAVSVNEWRVTPQDVDAHPGALEILVHNTGRLAHDLVISRAGERVTATVPIMPGYSANLLANLSPGSYVMSSSMVDDEATGIYGTLHVAR